MEKGEKNKMVKKQLHEIYSRCVCVREVIPRQEEVVPRAVILRLEPACWPKLGQ